MGAMKPLRLGLLVIGGWAMTFGRLLAIAPTVWANPPEASAETSPQAELTPVAEQITSEQSPSTKVKDWMAQIEAARVQITDVQIETTKTSLQVVLETAEGTLATPTTTVSGNVLTADIPNAVLSLPEGEAFEAANPAEGIEQVSVTSLPGNQVRVTVSGTNAPPVAEVTSTAAGLALVVTPGAGELVDTEDAELEITVTAERGEEEGYSPSNATTATRTDTPLRDTPQSIQVVPRQVLEDQQTIRASEALRNVSGVQRGNTVGNSTETFSIRGFQQFGGQLRDGFRTFAGTAFTETANLDRIEVLKGPASVLYGNLEPGGAINFVTEQPLSDPAYAGKLQVGSFGLFRPTLDLTGPLNSDQSVLYRLNAAYESGGNFRDFDQGVERFFIAPVLSFQIGDRTDLTLEFEYLDDERPFDRGLVAIGQEVADIPNDRILGELDDRTRKTQLTVGYRLEHEFNDDWKLRNRFQFFSSDSQSQVTSLDDLDVQTGELSRTFVDADADTQIYTLQTDLIGQFATGSIDHKLLFGVDLFRRDENFFNRSIASSSINIFDPIYGTFTRPDLDEIPIDTFAENQTDSIGIYLQDQITLLDNLKLLVGGRFDIIEQDSFDRLTGTTTEQTSEAFTPRVGIVYQPIQPISLYASYSQSFQPNTGNQADGSLLEPQRGTQYEVGVRGEFLDGRLTANLAAYDITKTNIPTTDPDNIDFVIPVGEQRSQGIELDIAGEILPGWNIIASYAYTDARVSEDNNGREGNRFENIPYNAASLWTTYEIQRGSLQGLGFGAGLFYVGERQGDIDNSFTTDSYLRTDASIFYRRDNWRAAINFNNIFDVDYIEASQRRTRINPGAPFAVTASFSVEF